MLSFYPSVLRGLVRQTRFTLLVVGLLGLGMGLGVALFSTVKAVLSPPFHDVQQLVWVADHSPTGDLLLTPIEYQTLRRSQVVFQGLAAYTQFSGEDYLTSRGTLYPVNTSGITEDLFPVLGTNPQLGRGFSAMDFEPVTILSWHLWQSVFHGDKNILGHPIQLNGFGFRVVGVMGPDVGVPENTDMWLPLRLLGDLTQPSVKDVRRLHVIGRLKSGISPSNVQAALDLSTQALKAQNQAVYGQSSLRASPLMKGLLSNLVMMLTTARILAISIFILVIANVGVLILLQHQRRRHETAIRLALGASPGSVVWVSALQATLLSLAGSILACLVAVLTIRLIRSWMGSILPVYVHVSFYSLFLTSCVFGLFSALALATAPKVFALRSGLADLLTVGERGIGNRSLRHALSLLLVFEIGATAALLLASAVSIHRFRALQATPLGIQADGLNETQVYLPSSGYKSRSTKVDLVNGVIGRMSAIPGVSSSAAGLTPALEGSMRQVTISPAESLTTHVPVDIRPVSSGYFRTLGLPVLAGHDFSASEMMNGGVAIVDAAAARLLWANQPAIGKTLRLDEKTTVAVVGIVGTTSYFGVVAPKVYRPLVDDIGDYQNFIILHFILRSSLAPNYIHQAAANVANSIQGGALGSITPVREELGFTLVTPRLQALMALLMSVITIIVASAGIYGVTAYWASIQTRETAIRVALGATPGSILVSHFKWLFGIAVASIAGGIATSILVSSWGSPESARIAFYDPLSTLIVFCIVISLVFTGTFIPTWRTARRNPQVSLRIS
jgi:predicted permease